MTIDAFKIEPIQPSDMERILAIENDCFLSPWSEQLFREDMANPLSRINAIRSVAQGTETLAGYIVYWLVADELHLQKIAVHREMRRQGLASVMLEEALRSSAQGITRKATLEVRSTNTAARQLYEKFGFRVKGVRPRYYDDTGEDALIMWSNFTFKD
jgi:ribosomal-protein-alanine N-acetyltransferase